MGDPLGIGASHGLDLGAGDGAVHQPLLGGLGAGHVVTGQQPLLGLAHPQVHGPKPEGVDLAHGSRLGLTEARVIGAEHDVADAYQIEAARHVAAELLEANPADVVLDADRGEFHVVGTPSVAVAWELVAQARAADPP